MTKIYLPRPFIEKSFYFGMSNMCGSKEDTFLLLSPLINDEIDTVYLPFMAIRVIKF